MRSVRTTQSNAFLKGRDARRATALLFTVVLVLAALVACDTAIPTVPPITINITAVDDTTALAEGIREALDATQTAYAQATETILAQGGVTLTPSPTATVTLTPTPSVTRFVTETPTPTPSNTNTPTYAPFLTNTPGPDGDTTNGWIRIVNAWRDITNQSPRLRVDVYINNERVSRGLLLGEQTAYFRVLPGAVRITLRPVDPNVSGLPETPPLISTVINLPPGGVTSVVAVNRGKGLELVNVPEDPTPLDTGLARLTILQANPALLEANVLLTSEGRALAYNLQAGDMVGPFDLPPGNYPTALYDALNPEQLIMSLPNPIRLSNQVNYLMVFVPPGFDNPDLTDVMMFSGITRRLETDLSVHFINISTRTLTIIMDSKLQVEGLPIGSISDSIPVSELGTTIIVQDPQGRVLTNNDQLGPWNHPDQPRTDKIILLTDAEGQATDFTAINIGVLSQDVVASAINANIRLVHALPNTRPLTLQIRPVRTREVLDIQGTPQVEQLNSDEVPWISVGDAARAGATSEYSNRNPQLYDIRVVLSGTNSVIGETVTVQLVAGGVYDFIALPGADPGSFSLSLIEPDTQLGGNRTSDDNATAVAEAVDATLTAEAPQTTATPTRVDTSTPTRTPFPTNTPRPTNTPNIPPPSIQVDPAPPTLAYGSLVVKGKDLAVGLNFTITIDNESQPAARGKISDDGTLPDTTVNLSDTIVPGSHTLTVCVDCGTRTGLHQVLYTVFIAADPNVTATPAESPTPTETPTP